MIRVNAQIELDEREIQEDFVRASGPGGQNVNKVSTAVQLRFDVAHSPSLPEPVRVRLLALIREACEVETPRRPTRPTLASKKRRLDSKQRRGETKKLRGLKPGTEH